MHASRRTEFKAIVGPNRLCFFLGRAIAEYVSASTVSEFMTNKSERRSDHLFTLLRNLQTSSTIFATLPSNRTRLARRNRHK